MIYGEEGYASALDRNIAILPISDENYETLMHGKTLDEYMAFTKKNGYFEYKRREQAKYWMYESINDTLRDTFYNNPQVSAQLEATEKQVLANAITPFIAAKRMMDLFLGSISGK